MKKSAGCPRNWASQCRRWHDVPAGPGARADPRRAARRTECRRMDRAAVRTVSPAGPMWWMASFATPIESISNRLGLSSPQPECSYAMAQRDYYEILGVSRSASTDELRRLSAAWRANIIPTSTRCSAEETKKRSMKLMRCFPIPKSGLLMTVTARRRAGRWQDKFHQHDFSDIFEGLFGFGRRRRSPRSPPRRGPELRGAVVL